MSGKNKIKNSFVCLKNCYTFLNFFPCLVDNKIMVWHNAFRYFSNFCKLMFI